MADRPWVLEVLEIDPDTIEEAWRPWSTYVSPENAIERRDKLIGKGHNARARNTDTGVVAGRVVRPEPVACPHCGAAHPPPFDGGCLL